MSATRPHVVRHAAARAVQAGYEVRWVRDWETRRRPYSFTPIVGYRHGTASRPSSPNFASLNIIIEGRSGLPGPLSQLYVSGARSGAKPVLYVIGCGMANHGGGAVWQVIRNASHGIAPSGRPPSADDVTVNRWAWGIEYEHSNLADEPIHPSMIRLMTVVEAGIAEAEGWTSGGAVYAANHWIDHREGTRRKIDLPHTLGDQRGRVAALLAGHKPPVPPVPVMEDDMRHGESSQHIQSFKNVVNRFFYETTEPGGKWGPIDLGGDKHDRGGAHLADTPVYDDALSRAMAHLLARLGDVLGFRPYWTDVLWVPAHVQTLIVVAVAKLMATKAERDGVAA